MLVWFLGGDAKAIDLLFSDFNLDWTKRILVKPGFQLRNDPAFETDRQESIAKSVPRFRGKRLHSACVGILFCGAYVGGIKRLIFFLPVREEVQPH